ncbi:MAG: hypothetical protein WBE14_27730 [Xanthobacteraceae bacterium]
MRWALMVFAGPAAGECLGPAGFDDNSAPVRIHNPIDGDRFLRAEMKEAAKKSPLRQGAGAFVVSQDDN